MIRTNPVFLFGDKMNFSQTMRALMGNSIIYYSSFKVWLKKVTTFASLILGTVSVLFLLAFVIKTLASDNIEFNLPAILLAAFGIPFILIMPFIYIVAYYYSFIKTRKISGKLWRFISDYFPDGTHVLSASPANFHAVREEYCVEVAYSLLLVKSKNKYENFYIIGIPYIPEESAQDAIFDESGEFNDEFLHNWRAYCYGKKYCRNVSIYKDYIIAPFRKEDLIERDIVENTIHEILYLCNRFNLKPQSVLFRKYNRKVMTE